MTDTQIEDLTNAIACSAILFGSICFWIHVLKERRRSRLNQSFEDARNRDQ